MKHAPAAAGGVSIAAVLAMGVQMYQERNAHAEHEREMEVCAASLQSHTKAYGACTVALGDLARACQPNLRPVTPARALNLATWKLR